MNVCNIGEQNEKKFWFSDSQTGFLKGRYIGESIHLVYDIINYCNFSEKKGLLMLIDFEKAFDSISWKFIYKVLKYL